MRVIKLTRKCHSLPIEPLVYRRRRADSEDLFTILNKILRMPPHKIAARPLCNRTQKKGKDVKSENKQKKDGLYFKAFRMYWSFFVIFLDFLGYNMRKIQLS